MVAVYSLPMRSKSSNNKNGLRATRNHKSPAANTRSSGRVVSTLKRKVRYNPRKTGVPESERAEDSSALDLTPSCSPKAAAESAADSDPKSDVNEDATEAIDDLLTHLHVDADGSIRDFEYDLLHKFTEDMHVGLTETSGRMYTRYQSMWKAYCSKYHVKKCSEYNEVHLLAFFNQLKSTYKPSTMWVVYSCVNHYFRHQYGKNLKDLFKLQSFLKNYSSRYVSKKSKVFTPEQMHTVLMVCQSAEDDTNLTLMGVGSALLYFGLLRSCDVLNINSDDVTLNEKEGKFEIRFEHMRKRKNSGFTYTLPQIYSPLFTRYMNELKDDHDNEFGGRFLRNFNKKSSLRVQNTGINTVRGWVKTSCDLLGISSKGYTAHLYRRSGATNLADAGVSFINLKRHGQWKSDAVVEGYIANSLPMRIEREQCLLPSNLRDCNLKDDTLQESDSSTDEASVDKVIKINGLGMWKYDRDTRSYVPLKRKLESLKAPDIFMLSKAPVDVSHESKKTSGAKMNALQAVRAENNTDRIMLKDADDNSMLSDDATVSYPRIDPDFNFDYDGSLMNPIDSVDNNNIDGNDVSHLLSMIPQVNSQPFLSTDQEKCSNDPVQYPGITGYSRHPLPNDTRNSVPSPHGPVKTVSPESARRTNRNMQPAFPVEYPGNAGYSRQHPKHDTRNSVPAQILFSQDFSAKDPIAKMPTISVPTENSGNTELSSPPLSSDLFSHLIPKSSSRNGSCNNTVFHNCTFYLK